MAREVETTKLIKDSEKVRSNFGNDTDKNIKDLNDILKKLKKYENDTVKEKEKLDKEIEVEFIKKSQNMGKAVGTVIRIILAVTGLDMTGIRKLRRFKRKLK